MRFEFVHAPEAGDHSEIEQAAVARLEVLVGPHRAPAKFVEQVLEFAIEIVGIGDRAIDIFGAQYLAGHRHALVVECLVHDVDPSRLTAISADCAQGGTVSRKAKEAMPAARSGLLNHGNSIG